MTKTKAAKKTVRFSQIHSKDRLIDEDEVNENSSAQSEDDSDSDVAPDSGSLSSAKQTFEKNLEAQKLAQKNIREQIKLKRKLKHERNLEQKKEKKARLQEAESMRLDPKILKDAKRIVMEEKNDRLSHDSEEDDDEGLYSDEDELLSKEFKGKRTLFDGEEEEEEPNAADLIRQGGVHVVNINKPRMDDVRKAQEFKELMFYGRQVKRTTNGKLKFLKEKTRVTNARRLSKLSSKIK